jgi:altronate dehydratase
MSSALDRYDLHEVGRLPVPGDNAAIAVRRLDAGTRIAYEGQEFALDYTVLEGHRFAIRPVATGDALLSWGLPFGYATRSIAPGNYLHNPKILKALAGRDLDFALPKEANFRDNPLEPYPLDPATFRPGVQAPRYSAEDARTFQGYQRGGDRGVGTRNHIVILATTSRTASWAKALEARFAGSTEGSETMDKVVAIAHTEGGGFDQPNNLDLLLRTLAGFIVHPNVGAVLGVDDGFGPVTNRQLRAYLREQQYPLDDVPHRFVTLRDSFEADLARGAALVRAWHDELAASRRAPAPVAALKLGLQCGGSDAFSGVSGNPLAAWVAAEILRHGGAANLAETDELIGAEDYILRNVRDYATAARFLATVARFKERVGWHGHTAEGNPSGGNNFRGLYNIALKSIGAAAKKAPDVRLDDVIEYGERMLAPGYYFMDSPGNDLESIAGQVASGSNLLYFVTGNGSITNFPFVPTVKIVTTTGRYQLLSHEMDVNAGEYLDGVPMADLGRRTFDLTLAVASGQRTVGERAGHAQVSIWRNWRQTGPVDLTRVRDAPATTGDPIPVKPNPAIDPLAGLTFTAIRGAHGPVSDQVGLVLPTSLCSGQIALRIADYLNARQVGRAGDGGRVSRYVALPHTEGCGVSSGSSEELYARTLVGYLLHPLVGPALLLEHGCEKTHNDYIRHELRQRGIGLDRFGWASVQLDGGIEAVTAKAAGWFRDTLAVAPAPVYETASLGALRLGLAALGPVAPDLARALARLTGAIVAAGGTVVVPENAPLLRSNDFPHALLEGPAPAPSLAYGEIAARPGLHVMAAPTDHWVETLTGLGATGVEIVLLHVGERPAQAHRLVPVLQVATDPAVGARYAADLDLALPAGVSPADWAGALLRLVLRAASRDYAPRLVTRGNVDFQFTRGLLGVSM